MTLGEARSLLEQVVELTRTCDTQGFVALYVYGSFTRGDMDEWSDLDVCLVLRPRDETLEKGRAWMKQMYGEFNHKVDPITLPLDQIGQDSSWDLSFVLWSLRNNSKLLLGEDVRGRISMPTEHKLRLSASYVAMSCVRRLYSIPREAPIPQQLPMPDISLERQFPPGNVAWAVHVAVVQVLRVIIFLETGTLCPDKQSLGYELQRLADRTMAGYFADAMALRKETPRFGPLATVPPRLERLAHVIPKLISRLFRDLRAHGLKDPSHEPDGPWYEPDGAPKFSSNT